MYVPFDRACRCLRLLLLLALLPLAALAASGERRVALVIGNDNYQSVSKLANARTDAGAVAKRLEAAGFTVILRYDLNEKAMKEALRNFKGRLGGGDVAVFYYAGHGVQLGAANYLLPTDVRGDNEEQVKDEAVPLQRILDDLQDQKAKFSLMIIDACRNNPFRQSGRTIGGRGLAPTTAATGQMVLFSAGAGQQALDKLGNSDNNPNGLFTRILLKEMDKPGVPVDRVLRNVREEVVRLAKSVNHEQVPALYDQALGEFYFHPAAAVSPALTPAQPVPPRGGMALDDLRKQQETRSRWSEWQATMKADFDKVAALNAAPDLQAAAWQRFIESYPQDNPFSPDAAQLRGEAQSRARAANAEAQRLAAGRRPQSAPAPTSAPTSATSSSGPTLKWRLASSFPKSLNLFFGVGESVARQASEATAGRFQIQPFAAGEIVPSFGVLDAVQAGTLEMAHTSSHYFYGKDPAFVFDTGLPFGLTERQHKQWLAEGGAQQLRDFFAGYKVRAIPCGSSGEAPMDGWFRKEIRSSADLGGMKWRIGGMAAAVLTKQGVVPQAIPGGEIYPSLEKGLIDASSWIGPYDDERLGFNKVARYYYTASLYRAPLMLSLYINLDAWNRLPAAYQTLLETACQRATDETRATYVEQNAQALRRLQAAGAQIRSLPPAATAALDRAATTVFEESAARSTAFQSIYERWKTYRSRSAAY